MANYTPGPWTVSGCRSDQGLLIEHGDAETFSPIIAEVKSDGARLPLTANARLIAAAPELLEAAKKTVAAFPSNKHPKCNCGHCMLRRAITKAEGTES